MTDLVEEVKTSFENEAHRGDGKGPIQIISAEGDSLAPGFMAFREHYTEWIISLVRHGYRHFAGASLPTDGEHLLRHTGEKMGPELIELMVEAFCDGLQIGHRSEHLVRMAFQFEELPHLFHDPDHREAIKSMAAGFRADSAVLGYFTEYVTGALVHIAVATGYTGEVEVGKVWDLWCLSGTAVCSASYLAGHRMGVSWRERDVLDGIEIASEEGS